MNILVFGKHGQVASEINKKLKVKSLGKKDFNLLNYKKISKKIKSINPDFIINTSSYNCHISFKNYFFAIIRIA